MIDILNTGYTVLEPDIDSYNTLADSRGWPRGIDDKGYVVSVWTCLTFRKAKLYGQFPPTFLLRLLSLFPTVEDDKIIHCPSGILEGPGMTVDIISDELRCPKVVASAGELPFGDGRFDLFISDPPYSKEDSKKYGCKPFPVKKSFAEAYRVLRPGGVYAQLHVRPPQRNRTQWKTRALIGVDCGPNKRMRVLTLLQKNGWQL